jgi:hypothetical protein
MILLDPSLSIRNGLEVLADLTGGPQFLTIPVVVLATSRRTTSSAAIRCTLTPPSSSHDGFDGFAQVTQQISGRFLGLNTLPP